MPKEKAGDSNTRSNTNPFVKLVNKMTGGNGNPPPPPPGLPQNQPDPNAQLLQYMQQGGLYEGIDMQEYITAVKDGDVEKATSIFNKGLENSVRVSLAASNKLMQAKMAKAVEDATSSADSTTRRKLAIEEMQKSLPFTAKDEFKPLAEQALQGFLDQEFSVADAIKNVDGYFKTLGKELGLKEVPKPGKGQRPGSKGFQQQNNENSQNEIDLTDDDTLDFVSVLTGGAQDYEAVNQQRQQQQPPKDPPKDPSQQ